MLPFKRKTEAQMIFLHQFIHRLLIMQTEVRRLSVLLTKKDTEITRLLMA
jgi:hypothetical protein